VSVRLGDLALEEILVARGLVRPERIAAANADRAGSAWLADRLVAAGEVSEEQIAQAIAEELSYPLVTPAPDSLDADLVKRVPAAVLRAHRALPLLDAGEAVDVAFADPLDTRALTAVSEAIHRRVRPAVATSSRILRCLRGILGDPPASAVPTQPAEDEAEETLRLHGLLLEAVEARATELHVVPDASGGRVRMRRGGALADVSRHDAKTQAGLVARVRSLAATPQTSGPCRATLSTRLLGKDLHLSISIAPTDVGDAAVLAIDVAGASSPLAGDAERERLGAFLASGDGLVVVNAARTATAAALLRGLRGGASVEGEQWVWCGEGPPDDVGPALHVRAEAFPGGFAEAVAAARSLAPDVLVLSPKAGTPPPPEAVLGARDGRRVVWVASFGSEGETRAALAHLGVAPASLDAVLRLVVTLREPAPGAAPARAANGAHGNGSTSRSRTS
jgi:type IV pilus assembly protein PilB